MIAPNVRQFGILLAAASLTIGACSPSSGGGSGKVEQKPIVEVGTDFDFVETRPFTVGESPANAAFSGGIATGAAWVIPNGETGVVAFTTPTRDLSFDADIAGLTSFASKPRIRRVLGKTICGVSDQGFDNSEPFGTEMFMRGGFNDWPAVPAAPQNFINFGDGTLQAEFEVAAGEWQFKVASAGWDVQFGPDPDAEGTLEVDGATLTMRATVVDDNGLMNIPEDGCYNFLVNATDPDNPTIALTKVELGGGLPPGGGKEECGIDDQGFDNSEPFGTEMFMRGGFNDWPAVPAAPQNFINFGDGTLQAEFEVAAGEWQFKVASAGWDVQFGPDPDAEGTLEVDGATLTMRATVVDDNGLMNIPEDGCYNFLVNATDPDNPTIALTKVELGGGLPPGGGKEECGIDDQGFDNSEPFGTEMFMRGGFNDWPAVPAAPQNFINFGDGTLQAEFEVAAGEWQFKVASAGWDVQFGPDPDAEGTLEVDGATLTMRATVVDDNGLMNIPEDGCYNFLVNATDPDNPTIALTKVELGGGLPPGGGKEECGIDDQGFDNSEPFGTEMFMRGGFNDWPAVPAAPQNFINFGDGTLQAEFEVAAGEWQFKVASAGWDVQFAPDPDAEGTLEVDGATLTMRATVVDDNGLMNIPEDGCYNFVVNATDPDNPTVALTEVEIGGGGPVLPGTTDFTATNRDGSTEAQIVEGTGPVSVSFTRGNAASPVKTLMIEAKNGDVSITNFRWTANPADAPPPADVDVVYRNASGDYSDTSIEYDGQSYACSPNQRDDFGCTATISTTAASVIGFTVVNGGEEDLTGAFTATTGDGSAPIYAISGNSRAVTGEVTGLPQENEVIVYYIREDETYDGWNLHLFPEEPATGIWTIFTGAEACVVEGSDALGTYFRITLPPNPCYDANPDPLDDFPTVLGFLIHQGDSKAPDGDITLSIAEDGNVVWIEEGNPQVLTAPPSGAVSIVGRAAHWVDAETVIWDHSGAVNSVELLYSADASIEVVDGNFSGNFETIELTDTANPQPDNQLNLGDFPAYALPDSGVDPKEILRAQIVALGRDSLGLAVEATFVQTPGALDAVYAENSVDAELGVVWNGNTPTIALWAPTALVETGVTLNIYSDPDTLDETVDMTLDEDSGIWTAEGKAGWDRKYYDFTLDVYTYALNAIVTNTVTDPYSVSLSANSGRSQVVNLDDQDLKPAGWDDLALPEYGEPEDIVVYEQHMRDYSASDDTVPEELRGKYQAFTLDNTDGHNHLQALSDAGLTHMHLLPSFDIATIEEERDNRVELDDPVEDLCDANPAASSLCPEFSGMTIREMLEEETAEDPASEFQQQVVEWLRGLDGYNWGYDPWHYGVPEGSYASDPDGVARIIEYREMVQGLAAKDLRLVIDVVYNHTNEGGQGSRSVLDRVVPGYYQRYKEETGAIESSTCCSNTASEFAMMGKLMDDTMIRFLEDYKITGFRFDLMGFHTKAQMEALLAKLRDIDPTVYIYGEGWDFGEVGGDARFVQATQTNLAGTGLGTFTDRIRDAVRGGGPFDGGIGRTINQGFINGGGYDPNAENSEDDEAFIEEALCTSDQIRATMAGSIATYSFTDREGNETTGGDLGYSRCTDSSPTAYVADPEEIINYVSSHDNETIFDISQYKHPVDVSTADRVRAENVGVDIVLLAQGVPFLHSGQDLLRSKSVDRDSFDFGDWFNQQDFSKRSNNWAVGLPNAEKNQAEWPDITELFDNTNSQVAPEDIEFAAAHTQEMLQVRASTVLFRLRTGEQIEDRVEYFNTGPEQVPGLIVQGIDGCTADDDLDPEYGYVVSVINANDEDQTFELFTDETFELHPVLQSSVDSVVQTATHDASGFFVPARTTAVFVQAQDGAGCDGGGAGPLPDIFVRGLNQDWDATADNELVHDGAGNYERVLTLADTTAADLSFKVADADWATVNCGAGADPNVPLDTPYPLNCGDGSGDLVLDTAATGDYKFSVDASDPENLVLTVYQSAYDVEIFVRGFNGDWNATPDTRLDLVSSNTYQTTLALPDPTADGALTFKVADADWSAVNCGGNGSNAELGADYALNCASDSGDTLLEATEAGEYSFTVNASDPANPVLVVEQAPYGAPIFVRGLNGDWGTTNGLAFEGGTTYRAKIAVPDPAAEGALTFKIASDDWSTVDCGGATVDVSVATSIDCSGGQSDITLNASEAGTYDFVLDAANTVNPELTVDGP